MSARHPPRGGRMFLLPPELLPGVPHFFFTLFGVPFTVAYPNLVVWIVLAVVFVGGAFLRLPRFIEGKDGARSLTRSAQRYLRLDFTLDDALPARMPVYVNSVVYLFGATALMALAWIVISGVVLTLGGPTWYHTNAVGRFANSVHFWSVQLFFLGLMLHFITKFFLGAWRDGRWLTWVAGGLLLGIGVFAGLTGFLLQTNWDAQWIATQAKDAMNAAGIGAFFNTMNTGQVLTLHVAALPLAIAALLGLHIFLIRRDSPVRPYDDRPNLANRAGAAKAGAGAASHSSPTTCSAKASSSSVWPPSSRSPSPSSWARPTTPR